jgi:hypothetical protein
MMRGQWKRRIGRGVRFQRYSSGSGPFVEQGDGSATRQSVGGPQQLFLERWKARAKQRRAKTAELLFASPPNPQGIEKLKMWLRNLEAREAWCVARLEHIREIESLLRSAVERNSSAR